VQGLLLVVLLQLVVQRVVRVVDQVGGAGADVDVDQAAVAALDGTEGVD
jgi:chitinase